MNTILKKALAIVGLLAAGVIFASTASAQCPAVPEGLLQKQSWHGPGEVRLLPVKFRHDDDDDDDDIVGFWNITLTAKGNVGIPDGAVLDKGLQQWHVGGTEFLNSSGQHPLTQNYCLGVWKKIGPWYVLNHFAYNYDAGQNVTGLTSIREKEIVVSRDGSTYNGKFEIQGYDLQRNKVGPLVTGHVNGKRIDVHTSPQDIL